LLPDTLPAARFVFVYDSSLWKNNLLLKVHLLLNKHLRFNKRFDTINSMKAFSDQIRDVIEASGVTRYALAKQAGIAESVLSRFMAGEQGMSTATLDKIAGVLGLEVIVGVQARKISKQGRPKKEEPMVQTLKKLTKFEWGLLAANAAKDAHENNFSSRRGVYVVERAGIVYYDNNPFKLPREQDPREDLISRFRDFLKRSGLKEKASAYWPVSGESKDYTFAMAIQADEYMLDAVRVGFHSIVVDFAKGTPEREED
jgi:transcriptional regulator with XRE-family HTH domain